MCGKKLKELWTELANNEAERRWYARENQENVSFAEVVEAKSFEQALMDALVTKNSVSLTQAAEHTSNT